MDAADYERQIREMEKNSRILQKKFDRLKANLIRLEETNDRKEALLSQTIRELKASQLQLEERGRELEEALANIQAMQARMLTSEKMSALGTLVAGVAHEINNPVNFIHGNLNHASQYTQDLLQLVRLYQAQQSETTPEIAAFLEEIDLEFLQEDLPNLLSSMQVGSERIRQIVESLRTFSRLDEADLKQVDIHPGLDSTLMILQHRLVPKSRQTEIKVIKNYGSLPQLKCYAGRLNQVFMNILSNAIDALREHDETRTEEERQAEPSQIEIETVRADADHLAIRIRDNGPGIDAAVQPKLFDPFFTTKGIGKGTGLGLSISYQIVVEQHGGSLTCQSVLGEGTEFLITLPLVATPDHLSSISRNDTSHDQGSPQ